MDSSRVALSYAPSRNWGEFQTDPAPGDNASEHVCPRSGPERPGCASEISAMQKHHGHPRRGAVERGMAACEQRRTSRAVVNLSRRARSLGYQLVNAAGIPDPGNAMESAA